MFQLVELKDRVQVVPKDFEDELTAIKYSLNVKYCGKVLPNIGLIVILNDILQVGQAKLHPGEGSAFFPVRFRVVVFAAEVGEVLEGRVFKSSPEGVVVTLGFFQNVLLHSSVLNGERKVCKYDEEKKEWYWHYFGEEDHKLYLSRHMPIRLKVLGTRFESLEAFGARKEEIIVGNDGQPKFKGKPRHHLLCVYGSIDDEGLGLVSWW